MALRKIYASLRPGAAECGRALAAISRSPERGALKTSCGGSCQGQTVTVGSACATTADCRNACVGGRHNGSECTDNSQCPGVCSGGSDDGKDCATGASCAAPGICNFGTCGKAFCASGGSCCATGSCAGAQLTCSGGANAGNTCTDGADCPAACAGGKNNGKTCSTGSDCPGVCPNGPNAGEQCATDANCGGGDFKCNTGSCANLGTCGRNTYSLYCTSAGLAPATLAELALAAPGVCSLGGPCGPPCEKKGGTCSAPNQMAAASDFMDVQLGIDGGNLPVVVTPVHNTYEVTANLIGVDVLDSSSCINASDCSANAAPYNHQCFSPTSYPKLFGPVGGKCAASCTSDSECTKTPFTKCFKAPAPFAPLSSGICINPCTSNTQCANAVPSKPAYPACDVADGACVSAYECTSPGCNGATEDCGKAGPPGAPYLPICQWKLLAENKCPPDLQIRECVGGTRKGALCGNDTDCGQGGTCSKYIGCGSACSQCQPEAGVTQPPGLACKGTTTVPWAPTNTNLYCCTPSNSCFDAGASPPPTAETCCGYALWARCVGGDHPGNICGTDADCGTGTCTGVKLPQGQATPAFGSAVGSGTWLGQAEPIDVEFKNDCPTAYSYQYDDSTSTFVCGGVSGTSSAPIKPSVSTAYTITFLNPAGTTGVSQLFH